MNHYKEMAKHLKEKYMPNDTDAECYEAARNFLGLFEVLYKVQKRLLKEEAEKKVKTQFDQNSTT